MPAAVPLIAVVAGGVASATVGGGIIGAIVGAGAAFVVSTIGASVFPAKRPTAPTSSAALRPGDDPTAPGADRTQSFRQPITEHQIVFGRCKVGGPIDGAGTVRENQPQDVLASGTTMQWDTASKSWQAGAIMQVSSLNRRQTLRLGAGVAFAQIGIIGFDGQIELEALRLYSLPEDAAAILYGCAKQQPQPVPDIDQVHRHHRRAGDRHGIEEGGSGIPVAAETPIAGPAGVEASFDFRAAYNATNTAMMTVVLKNQQAATEYA